MRSITFILLFYFTITNAQIRFDVGKYEYGRENYYMTKKNTLITAVGLTVSVICGGIGDGYNDMGKFYHNKHYTQLGHFYRGAEIGLLILTAVYAENLVNNRLKFIAKYGTIRFALKDYSYNLTRGLPLYRKTDASSFDRFYQPNNEYLDYFIRGLSFTIGVSININTPNKLKRYE